MYLGYIILRDGSFWACPELGIYGTIPEVKKAITQISTDGWHNADIETFTPPVQSTTIEGKGRITGVKGRAGY